MPRKVSLKVTNCGKSADGYKFSKMDGHVLQLAGWTLAKRSREYWHMRPPKEIAATKEISVAVDVPTQGEVLVVAERLHAAGEACFEWVGGWPGLYTPVHTKTTTIDNNELDLKTGGWEFTGIRDIHIRPEEAHYQVGSTFGWHIEVRWDRHGKITVKEDGGQSLGAVSALESQSAPAGQVGLFD